jgi:Protein of unknown function (DUF3592)
MEQRVAKIRFSVLGAFPMTYRLIGELLKYRTTHVLLMVLGLGLFGYFLYEDDLLNRIRSRYQSTPCMVQSAEVAMHETRNKWGRVTQVKYYPEITYTYAVAGKPFLGNVYRHSDNGMELEEAAQVLQQYKPGVRQSCWVDPEEPGKAVLNRESDRRTLYTIATIALISLLGGAIGWAFLEFVVHAPARLPPVPTRAAPKQPQDMGRTLSALEGDR